MGTSDWLYSSTKSGSALPTTEVIIKLGAVAGGGVVCTEIVVGGGGVTAEATSGANAPVSNMKPARAVNSRIRLPRICASLMQAFCQKLGRIVKYIV